MKVALFILFAGALIVIIGCKHPTSKTIKKDSINIKAYKPLNIKKDPIAKKIYPLTDSGQLMLHLDSLLKAEFPYESEGGSPSGSATIDLSALKNKNLFNIPLKLIPRQIGAGSLDHGGDLDDAGILTDSIRETFNLMDTITYKTTGILVAATPKFVVIDLEGILVTLSYHAHVIDAIHSSTSEGNNHWHVERNTTIKKDLTMILHHWFSVQTDEAGHYDYENEYENWFIDDGGHIKKQKSRRTK